MFSTTLDVGDLLREDLHITFVRDKGKQKIYLNGIKVFQTRHGYHTEPLEMVYTLSTSTFNGKLNEADVKEALPNSMAVDYLLTHG